MFMAAMIPGLIAVVFFILTILIYVLIVPDAGPRGEPAARAEFISATLGILPVALVFAVVIGGLYFGFFNPTPAASAGVVMVALIAAVRGKLSRADLRDALLETARTAGMIYLILLGAELLKIFMSRGGVPQAIAEMMAASGLTPMTTLLVLLLVLILLGCLMDSLSMILLAIPFFWPVLVEINGGDWVAAADSPFVLGTEDLKIWFGILALIVVELGLITPPVGMNVFIISAQARTVPMRDIFIGVMPFFAAELIRVGVLIAFPALTLWLPAILRQ